jgi:hypothetical protein
MTCDQQHNIRNGIVSVCTLLRWLLTRTDLTALQRRYLEDALGEAFRVEAAACTVESCDEKIKSRAGGNNPIDPQGGGTMFDPIKKTFELLFAYKSGCQDGKKPWRSKTIWTNALAVVVVVLAKYADIQFSSEDVGIFLSAVNIVLRLMTKSPTGFYEARSSR